MKKSLTATSIIEAIIVLLIVVSGITGVYQLLTSSQNLANSTSNRIEAIQIARDGLEAFTSIRDTNWILFAADYENCWNVVNYNLSCVGNSTNGAIRIKGFLFATTPGNRTAYRIFQSPLNQFELISEELPLGNFDFSDPTFRSTFKISKEDGFYTQSGGIDTLPLYTRYIKVSYQETDGVPGILDTSEDALEITSVVEWNDNSNGGSKKLEMSTTLTNWKAKQ